MKNRNRRVQRARPTGQRLGQPRVAGDLRERDPLGGLPDEHLGNQLGERRRDTGQGLEGRGKDRRFGRLKGWLPGHHVVEDHAQAPDVHLRAIGLLFHLCVVYHQGHIQHPHGWQHLALTLVVTSNLVGTIEGAPRRVVEQPVSQDIQNVFIVHLRHVNAAHCEDNPPVFDALFPRLPQRVAFVSLLCDNLDDSGTLPVRPRRILADAEWPDAEFSTVRLVDVGRVRSVEVVPSGQDHLRGHGLERTDAIRGLQDAILRPVPRSEVDELHEWPVLVVCGVRAEQYVVSLEVSVDDLPRVQVLHGFHYLLENVLRLVLAHLSLLADQVTELASPREFHHNHLPPRPARNVTLDVDGVH
mmetsp:Transcript_37755/g.107873  ORF Transcript_37755/g.107873 Transcript_37755/m.107873 type:complete len:357 (-) Transcript_37755:420-1490(-)